jgi:hypothetical protein
MMTVVKLLIAAAILNATVRGGMATWDHYQLKDAAHRVLLHGAGLPPERLHSEILSRAAALHLPLKPGDLVVHRDGMRTVAHAAYVQPVELFPRRHYPLSFSFDVETLAIPALTPR